MLRHDRQIKPGLVALCNIRPGNGVGLFLQLRRPHRASRWPAAMHVARNVGNYWAQESRNCTHSQTCSENTHVLNYFNGFKTDCPPHHHHHVSFIA